MWTLIISSAWLGGWLYFAVKPVLNVAEFRTLFTLSALFFAALVITFIATDNKYVGFFGESSRRTGFIAYIALTIFFLVAALVVRFKDLARFDLVVLISSTFIGLYGCLQHFKIDPIKWNNPYNSVLSTLGNPDFASAVMGILAVLCAGIVLNTSAASFKRMWALALVLLLFITVLFSLARQGLLAAVLGLGLIFLIWAYQKNKYFGHLVSIGGIFAVLLGIFGMLNNGPFAKYLYKASITFRGDYWRAGMNMFKHHLMLGVGLDRYGAYFRQYRDSREVFRRGANVVSNAAHNVPIQIAATGGLVLFLTFLALTIFVGFRGYKAIRKFTGNQQLLVGSIVAAWVAYQAQSLISIDNLGIAIWGWLLGGLVVGLSFSDSVTNISSEKNRSSKSVKQGQSIRSAQPMISGIATTLAIALCIPLFLADSSMRLSRAYSKPTKEQETAYITAVQKPLGYGLQDPTDKLIVATLLAQVNRIDLATPMIQSIIKKDPRNYGALDMLSQIFEQTNQRGSALSLRQQMIQLDPINQSNYLSLGQDYVATGNKPAATALLPKILEIAPSSAEAKQAKTEFGS